MQAQPLRNGQHHLPVCYGRTNVLGHVDGRQEHPLLMAGWANAALLAGEGHEHLVPAIAAADPGEAFVQVAAAEKGRS